MSFQSEVNCVNYAEAYYTSPAEIDAAEVREVQALLEIIDLIVLVADRHATNQAEIEEKRLVLKALTEIRSCEGDELVQLRESIERDQAEVKAQPCVKPVLQPQKLGWSDRFGSGRRGW